MRHLAAGAFLLLSAVLVLAAAPASRTPAIDLLADAAHARLRSVDDAARITVRLESDVLDLRLERFSVVDADTQLVVRGANGRETARVIDPDRVVLLRGGVEGQPGSSAFLSAGAFGVRGSIDLDGTRYAIGGGKDGPITVVPAVGAVGTPPVDVCGVEGLEGITLPLAGTDTPAGIRQLDIAVDTDNEYYEIFGNDDDATDYLVAMYGAISDIYLRDVHTHLRLSFIRLWDTPLDLFNEDNPLGPFVDHWNANMAFVTRDVAQLITGRRNLPYGGVAYLSSLCNESAYSVCGYILGALADPAIPGSANWDVVVTAHELGHNAGTGHTHNYGIDNCAGGDNQRGTIMSYCHTTAGGTANIDLRFHRLIQPNIESYVAGISCAIYDCNQNGTSDALEISLGVADANMNGVPDTCEDCNTNGMLDDADIALGTSDDVDANGVPDECQADCGGDGIPDTWQIALGEFADLNGDEVPDGCEADCDDNGVSDYEQIQADMSLDLDRDAQLDACQDCDGNGTPDLDDLAGGLNLWVGSSAIPGLRECHGSTGVGVSTSVGGLLTNVNDVRLASSGLLLVAGGVGRIAQFDSADGTYVSDLITPGDGGLTNPSALAFSDAGTVLVTDAALDAVYEYDAGDGTFLGVFAATGGDGLVTPMGLVFGPNGNLFVSGSDTLGLGGRVAEYDGTTGAFIGTFVTTASGGLDDARGLLFKPDDGNLIVASFATNRILEYDGTTGVFIGRFDHGGLASGFWGLENPWGLRLAPRGDMVIVSAFAGNAAIHGYDIETGVFMRNFYVLDTQVAQPSGFDVMPASAFDCNQNFRHDACDIAAGLLADTNDDGVPDACQCPADTNGDLDVDVNDLVAVITSWGACPGCPADVNGDGVVDVNDINEIVLGWGSCG